MPPAKVTTRSKSFETAVFEEFRKIHESIGALNQRMDRLEEDHRRLRVRFEALEDKFDSLVEGYDLLDKKIDRHYQEFTEFRSETNVKFDAVFGELRLIRSELKTKADKNDLLGLMAKVNIE